MLGRFSEALEELSVPMRGNLSGFLPEHLYFEYQPLDVPTYVLISRLGSFELGMEFLNGFIQVFFLHISSPFLFRSLKLPFLLMRGEARLVLLQIHDSLRKAPKTTYKPMPTTKTPNANLRYASLR